MHINQLSSFFKWTISRVPIVIFISSLLLPPWAAFATEQKDNDSEPRPPSKIFFTFKDQSTLTMSENAIFSINNHTYNPGTRVRETIITVSQGWAHLKTVKGKDNLYTYKIVTPTATAGLHGKEFETVVNARGVTTFKAVEGQVKTFSNLPKRDFEKSFLISAGQTQSFFPDGSHSPVKTLLKILSPGLDENSKF